jgi:hypothetical protein
LRSAVNVLLNISNMNRAETAQAVSAFLFTGR